jgi:hypothetical protein
MDAAHDGRVVRAVLTSPMGCSTQLAPSPPQLLVSRLAVAGDSADPEWLTAVYEPDSRAAKRCLPESERDSLAICAGRAVDAYDDRPVITQFHHGDHQTAPAQPIGKRIALWPVMTATLPSTTPSI